MNVAYVDEFLYARKAHNTGDSNDYVVSVMMEVKYTVNEGGIAKACQRENEVILSIIN